MSACHLDAEQNMLVGVLYTLLESSGTAVRLAGHTWKLVSAINAG